MKLTPAQCIILSKFASDAELKAAREQLTPGDYSEAFTIDVSGTIAVGKDGKAKPSIGWKELAGWLLERVNPATRDALVRAYIDAKDSSAKLEGGALAEAAEAALDTWLEEHKVPRKGQVRGACALNIIDLKQEAA